MNGTKIGPFRQTNMYRLARMLVDSASDALKPVFNKLGGEISRRRPRGAFPHKEALAVERIPAGKACRFRMNYVYLPRS